MMSSMTYSLKYKLPGQKFFSTIKEIKADGIMNDAPSYPIRFLITSTEERIEIPIPGTTFLFSEGRFASIKQKMDEEAGFEIKIRR